MENRSVLTGRFSIQRNSVERDTSQVALASCAGIIARGGLVAIPTETVYGLGANAFDASAVESIFRAKERPNWDPIIVHVADRAMLAEVVSEVPAHVEALIEKFWPGSLTLLLPRSARVPDVVTAGRPLVGVRMPADNVALAFIRAAGVPIAAPSANRFGHTSPTTADHVLDDLRGRIDAVIDAGPCSCGVESTVLDPNQEPMVIYRPGAVTREMIAAASERAVEFYRESWPLTERPPEALPSPGVGLRHYAPEARLVLVEGGRKEIEGEFLRTVMRIVEGAKSRKLGVLWPKGFDIKSLTRLGSMSSSRTEIMFYQWGRFAEPAELARGLFTALRAFDAGGCDMILAPVPEGEGIAAALRDRMRKAASEGPLTR